MRPMDPAAVADAKAFAERGLWGFETLHLGPLDHNVFTVTDNLRTAAALLDEAFRQSRREEA